MPRKYTQEEIEMILNKHDCKLLSEYKNSTTRLKLKCKCGNIFNKSFKIMNQSKKFMCNDCINREQHEKLKISYNEAKTRLKERGFELLCSEKDYIGFNHKYKVVCENGHVREQWLGDVYKGHKCKVCASKINGDKCKLSYDEVKNFVESKDLVLLSKEYDGVDIPLKVKCNKCNSVFYPRLHNLKKGSGCPNCYNKIKSKWAIIPYKERKEYVESFGFKLITKEDDYIDGEHKVEIECDEGHRYETNLHRFYSGTRCPICKKSKGEVKISKLLEKYRIKYISQYRFNDCKFYRYLPFDFYLPDYDCCIEFDGKQHYMIGGFGRDFWEFVDIKIRDTVKTEYCKKNNIKLIRIPYWEINNIEEILNKEINKLI